MVAGSAPAAKSNVRLVAFASAVGTTVEWYDFFLYGTVTSLVFNKLFFPQFDPVVGTLLAYVTFAIGFVARPIGAVVFGHYGDRLGRKRMLVLTLLIMGVATFLIGLLPTYGQIGVSATILLLLLRITQGFGLGGEWGGAVLMAAEHSPEGDRGFYASWPQIGVPAGLALGTIVTTILNQGGPDFFLSYGWRIAFLLSAFLVIIGVYIRLKIVESPQFEQVRETQQIARVPFRELWRGYWQNVLLGMGIRYIEGVGFNLYGVFIIAYLTNTLKYPRTGALTAVTIAAIVMIFFIPVWSRLSDRIGRRRVFASGVVATGLLVYPAFWLMQQGLVWAWVAIAIPFGIAYAAIYGPEAALFSELFDTRVRYSGISFVYQFSGIFASGLTPIVATALIAVGGGMPWLVAAYVVVVSVISLACCLSIRKLYMNVPGESVQGRAPVVSAG